jgi:predicted nucleic acid-binding protein
LSRLVVDASVAVKWFLPEAHSEAARALLGAGHELIAPELIYAELGSALLKRVRKGEIEEAVAAEIFSLARGLRMDIHPMEPLLEATLRISATHRQTFYDSLYLALALGRDARLITADRPFYDAIRASNLAPQMVWVEEEAR